MRITKKETKLMAFILTFVMMLSGLVCVPTESKAAGDAPKVSILGASLRLDATEGCQSMRIGLKVENASKAKACGLELTIGENENSTIKIATNGDGAGVLKGDKIYDYDEVSDALIYTVVITNIPKDNYDTEISAKGTVTPINNGAEISTTPAGKTVSSIVESLKTTKLPNLQLLDDGSFASVTDIASLDATNTTSIDSIKNHAPNNDFYLFGLNWTAAGQYDKNVFEATNKDAAVEYDDGEAALKFTTDTKIGKGLSYRSTQKLENLVCEFRVKAEEGTKLSIVNFWSQNSNSQQTYTATGDWQTISCRTTIDGYDSCCLGTVNPGDTYYVKSCKIAQYTPLTAADFGSITLPRDFNVVLSEDTAVKLDGWHLTADKIKFDSINDSASATVPQGQGMAFYLKEDHTPINSDDYSKIEICCSADKDTIIRTGACTDDKKGYDNANIKNSTTDTKADQDIVITIDLTDQQSKDIYAVLVALNWNTSESATVTVKSIKAYSKK